MDIVADARADAGAVSRLALYDLPVEIGFLLLHGVSFADLRQAAARAASIGVSADRIVIARGLVSEDAFYRALAAYLGAPFLSRDFQVAASASRHALRAGFVALADGGPARVVLAPQGPALRVLLQRPQSGLPGAAITTPALFRRCVWESIGQDVMVDAATGFSLECPRQSARGGATAGQQRFCAAAAAGLAVALTMFGAPVVTMLGLMACAFFGLAIWVRLAAACETLLGSPEPASPPVSDRDLPTYTVALALYREAAVARQLVAALDCLDYPREKLDIKLMLEDGDAATKAALEAQKLGPHIEIVVCPDGRPRTKPRALNAALALARGELLVVYDAEDIPDAAQLRLAAARFRRSPARLACVQARLVIDNTDDGLLARFFTIEYAALFDVLLPGLARLGCPLPLGGTSNHFRVRALRDVLGWDAWNVTEDADLGLRLARAGYHVATLSSDTLEEAPSRLRPWLRQRTRWLKGWMQTAVVHARDPRLAFAHLGALGYLALLVHTFGTVLTALAYPFTTAIVAYRLWEGSLLRPVSIDDAVVAIAALTILVTGGFAMIGPALIAVKGRALYRLAPLLPLLPFYYVLVSVAAWIAMAELFRAPTQWNKTEHGLARTSRLRRLAPSHAALGAPDANRP